MQPTDRQVEASLDYLRTTAQTRRDALAALVAEARSEPTDEGRAELPEGILERIRQAPDLRSDRLAEARQRVAAGDQPDADALAARMVGRLVCDRLGESPEFLVH